jgi:hypothetical protein
LPSTQAHYLSEELASNHRLQILVRNRLDNIPRFIEHLDFRAPIAGALPCVALA